MSALKTTWRVVSPLVPSCLQRETDDGVWLSKARGKSFADIMNGAILGPGCGDDWVDVLTQEGWRESVCMAEIGGLTFDFGGAGFGLHAFLTTFSKEDISVLRRANEPHSRPDDVSMTKTFLLWTSPSRILASREL